jgi:hypothetical protein
LGFSGGPRRGGGFFAGLATEGGVIFGSWRFAVIDSRGSRGGGS